MIMEEKSLFNIIWEENDFYKDNESDMRDLLMESFQSLIETFDNKNGFFKLLLKMVNNRASSEEINNFILRSEIPDMPQFKFLIQITAYDGVIRIDMKQCEKRD